jgi:hypothetical protein
MREMQIKIPNKIFSYGVRITYPVSYITHHKSRFKFHVLRITNHVLRTKESKQDRILHINH